MSYGDPSWRPWILDARAAEPFFTSALDAGITFFDTADMYSNGASEVVTGTHLTAMARRDEVVIATKVFYAFGPGQAIPGAGVARPNQSGLGRKHILAACDDSLRRLGTDYIDLYQIHRWDPVVPIDETLEALNDLVRVGKVRFIGVSGYPMNLFRYILDRTDLDVVLSYNHYTLQNTMFGDLVPYLKQKNVGIMNAAPFSARLLTNAPLPKWHKATPEVRDCARRAAEHCQKHGVDIAQLALQYSIANEDLTTCIVGSANPENVRNWVRWSEQPLDRELLDEVLTILRPIHNWFYIEGRPENNDPR